MLGTESTELAGAMRFKDLISVKHGSSANTSIGTVAFESQGNRSGKWHFQPGVVMRRCLGAQGEEGQRAAAGTYEVAMPFTDVCRHLGSSRLQCAIASTGD
jgi:hypothetical protein